MKLSINVRKLYPEALFYINWAKKSKKKISYKSIKRNQVSFKRGSKKKNFDKILVNNSKNIVSRSTG